MNQKIKYIGLLAILPLAMVAFAPDLIGDAFAQKAEESSTSIDIFAISEIGENMYKAVFTVSNNSDKDIQKFQALQVSSDSSSKAALVTGISANSYTYVPVIIEATDPATINAELAT